MTVKTDPPRGMPHMSCFKHDILIRNDAFIDGVCHAVDVLRELGEDAAADRVEAKLFVKRDAEK